MPIQKLIVLLARCDGIDRLQFEASWRLDRAPLVASLPGLARYVRNEVVEEIKREHMVQTARTIGGMEDLWFETDAARNTALQTLRENKCFRLASGIATMCALAVSERVIFDRSVTVQPLIKRLSFLTRRRDMTAEAFANHWQSVHAPLAFCHRFVDRYVQNHVADSGSVDENRFLPDGIAEFFISDTVRMQEDYRSEAGVRMKQDVNNFVGSARTYYVKTCDVAIPAVR